MTPFCPGSLSISKIQANKKNTIIKRISHLPRREQEGGKVTLLYMEKWVAASNNKIDSEQEGRNIKDHRLWTRTAP